MTLHTFFKMLANMWRAKMYIVSIQSQFFDKNRKKSESCYLCLPYLEANTVENLAFYAQHFTFYGALHIHFMAKTFSPPHFINFFKFVLFIGRLHQQYTIPTAMLAAIWKSFCFDANKKLWQRTPDLLTQQLPHVYYEIDSFFH